MAAKVPSENSWTEESPRQASDSISETSDGYLRPRHAQETDEAIEEGLAKSLSSTYIHPSGILCYNQLPQYANTDKFSGYESLNGNTMLDLNGRHINQLAMFVSKRDIKSIEVLNLENNAFLEFPHEVFKMPALIYLNLASQISLQRASISQWPALANIPKEIDKLKHLTHLILWNNAITSLPLNMSKMRYLIHLDLRLNQLHELPSCVCVISTLQDLWLSGNYIETLPPEIQKLQSLASLRIANNKLQTIPDQICELLSLTYLSLRNNNLTELPSKLYKLNGLLSQKSAEPRLLLDDNNFVYPPKKIISKGTKAIFKYLEETQDRVRHRLSGFENPIKNKERKSKTPSGSLLNPLHEDIESSLERTVQKYGLMLSEHSPGYEGNFFIALEEQLRRPGMKLDNTGPDSLRQMAVQYIMQDNDEEITNLIEGIGTSVDQYTQQIVSNETWADEITVKTMARCLQRDIHVIPGAPNQDQVTKKTLVGHVYEGGPGKPLLLGHCLQFHYRSLLLPDESIEDGQSTAYVKICNFIIPRTEKILNLSEKKLEELPKEIKQLTDIEILILDRNSLIEPDWISTVRNIKSLKTLSLKNQIERHRRDHHYNILHRIPSDLHTCRQLTHLSFARNRIISIPNELSNLDNLKVLDLVKNCIQKIPGDLLESLTQLEYLGLSQNEITKLPNEIGNLTKLKVLRLSHNYLTCLPDSICDLENLMCLSLMNNKLFYLPQGLSNLTGLLANKIYHCDLLDKTSFNSALYLDGNNDLIVPPYSICVEDEYKQADQVISYLTNTKDSVLQKQIEKAKKQMKKAQQKNIDAMSMVSDVHYDLLTDKFFLSLSSKLGNEWRGIGTSLNMGNNFLTQCDTNSPRNVTNAIFQMLVGWRNQNMGKHTEDELIHMLFEALIANGRNDLHFKLSEKYKEYLSQDY